ncbi:uncharacterized protein LOC132221046 [Myotis daubentonii]|uniref:uncharacterized protein LOC132221046 n=1 Tax=Myotis daubentonii TaxID=98922 RepID=UPI002873B727|nr:uncharacterized protein LOC132221046 [Myotis daubentonii]
MKPTFPVSRTASSSPLDMSQSSRQALRFRQQTELRASHGVRERGRLPINSSPARVPAQIPILGRGRWAHSAEAQALQVPEEQSEARASLAQPAGWKGQAVSLAYLPGRQRAHRSDRHKVQILSEAVAAASGAPVPGDRAKACIKPFTAPTRPGFNGTEKVLTNQVPWQGPASNARCPSHATTARVPPAQLTSAGLRWKGLTLPPGFQTTRIQRFPRSSLVERHIHQHFGSRNRSGGSPAPTRGRRQRIQPTLPVPPSMTPSVTTNSPEVG